MDLARTRVFTKMDLAYLTLELFTQSVNELFLDRGVNEATLRAEKKYAHTYAWLEAAAEGMGDHDARITYGAQKREHAYEADRIARALHRN